MIPTYRDSQECFAALALEMDAEAEFLGMVVRTLAEWVTL